MRKESVFSQNLRAFLKKHPVTGERTPQHKLAEHLGVRTQTVSAYCVKGCLPNCEALVKIAEFFGVSCDYMLTGQHWLFDRRTVREYLGHVLYFCFSELSA